MIDGYFKGQHSLLLTEFILRFWGLFKIKQLFNFCDKLSEDRISKNQDQAFYDQGDFFFYFHATFKNF